ncbi:PARP-domain-containing protein [Artomyces pyxidatus]|uniref:PARP-domain-containing protein n=1 Tax=Artomyces pyxidatus TaxID=48021 RepID=A0ACB8T2Y8_9AGAM|nr:PARP-domain-containing protein [Artomyces pyxidatus]
MPPRKKTATDAAAPAAKPPSRASTRAKAPVSKAKPASKRAKADSDSETDKPVSKRAKTDKSDGVDEPQKMVTVIKRGAAPVDPCSGFVDTHQVYENEEDVWDAMLNQTDIGKNANKFYVIQLLHPIGNSTSSVLLTRWGRVGEDGSKQIKGPFSASQAVNEFKKQFKAKAGTAWEQRKSMVAKKGKYMWLERVFEDDKDDDKQENKAGPSSKAEPEIVPESTLATEIQALCRLIFSASLIEAHLSSMNYDANKLPLGKLAKAAILNGFSALKTLSEVLEHPDSAEVTQRGGFVRACEDLTSNYYSIIPHVFGRNRPTIINNTELLKKELELVDALGDMEIAQKLIQASIPTDANGNRLNPMDSQFRSLKLSSMEPVNPNSKEFRALAAYAANSHGHTHNYYTINIQHAYRVERQEETDAWNKASFDKLGDGQRLLLWHGSRSTNFAGILRQGLRIAPPEAPVTGYMFGKGVYFADMVSKSANYCYTNLSNSIGLLLLCEVAANPVYELKDSNYNADQACKAANKMATKGIGQWQPDKWQDAGSALDNDALTGCSMPDGPGKQTTNAGGLLYNEYIVYSPSQIRLRYLIMFKMESKY